MFVKVLNIFIFILFILFNQCHPPVSTKPSVLRIKGSDTMLILMEKLSSEYMQINPNTAIYTEGGGSASGIMSLIKGDIDICAASRLLTAAETSQMAQKYSSVGYYTSIAKDALSVYVNPHNPVQDLTLKQLKQIFTGQIRNWREVGGEDRPIVVYIRPPNSGTYYYFREHILEDESYLSDGTTTPTTSGIVQAVLQHEGGIGYGGIAYGEKIVHCRINGIPPTPDNIRYNLYPISRYLYLYTIRKPRGLTADFIDWILSREGQKIVQEVGYTPILPVENQ